MRTIILKLHKPGKEKREILDKAILNYNQAYRILLEKAYEDIENIRERFRSPKGFYSAASLTKWIGREVSDELNQFHVQPFKDALRSDTGMTLAGYLTLSLRYPQTSFPKVKPTFSEGDGLSGLMDEKALRPVYFCRYDTKRSYCLLYNQLTDRYFAKLYLTDRAGARPALKQAGTPGMIYISKDKKAFAGGKKETYILVPLSFGKYQERYLRSALDNPGILRTAKLYTKGKDYYLAVSLDAQETESIKTETFLGAARGIENKLYYTVIDREGSVIEAGPMTDQSPNKADAKVSPEELHRMANRIVNLAVKYRSQVIVQNLKNVGDRINWTESGRNITPQYNCRDYNRLVGLLDYKLQEKGLPGPVKVSSADIFYRCPVCGHNSRGNRFTKNVFLCTKCGATKKTDQLGSLNLAGKLISYHQSKLKIKITRYTDGTRYANPLIGLDLFLSFTEDHPERLREELHKIIEAMKSSNDNERKPGIRTGILRKLEDTQDILQSFEFV